MDVHLINSKNETIVVRWRDILEAEESGSKKYSDFGIDVDWYLNNGYRLIDDVIKDLKGIIEENTSKVLQPISINRLKSHKISANIICYYKMDWLHAK